MTDDSVSRRSVLAGVGASVGAAATAGVAVADGEADVLVGVNGRGPAAQVERKANEHERTLDFGDLRQVVHGKFPAEAIDGLRQNPHVEYIEENGEYRALAQTLPWGIDRVDADVVHANGSTGSGADVAIIDTGIDEDHPDLQANLGAGKAYAVCDGSNGSTCNNDWDDDNDHGTHCAGIADAVDNTEGVVGVSTEATLHAVKVLDSGGGGNFSDVAAGIEYVADQGWDVASMSLGASSGAQTVKDACTYADNNGVLLVASAGNSGPCSDCVGYPAAYSEVVAVSSTDSDDSLSSFSSTGPEVELAAPGGSIYSTIPGGYDTFSGTSMACPHVSGAGGQLMANGASNTQARDTLKQNAENLGLASNESGAGFLDVAAALGHDSSDDGTGSGC